VGRGNAPKPAKKKVPANALPEKPGRIPRRLRGVSLSNSGDGHHIVFRLQLLDLEYDGSWSWKSVDPAGIVKFLTQMELATWAEITTSMLTGGRRRRGARNKFIPVEALCSEARERLVELGIDDVDELFRFRHGNMGRLWGLLLDEEGVKVFYPIWWDPEHKVCSGDDE